MKEYMKYRNRLAAILEKHLPTEELKVKAFEILEEMDSEMNSKSEAVEMIYQMVKDSR